MATIEDMIGGVVNFERVDRTVQWAAINSDSSKHRDRVDDGWWWLFDRGRSDVTPGSTVQLEGIMNEEGGFDSWLD
jgi:hypothetical protein